MSSATLDTRRFFARPGEPTLGRSDPWACLAEASIPEDALAINRSNGALGATPIRDRERRRARSGAGREGSDR
jgi:hypothetical protein